MVLSSKKKRPRSKSHIFSNGNDDRNALGEVLDRSTKTKQKKRPNELVNINHRLPSIDIDVDTNISSLPNETPVIYRKECLCETHYAKQLIERTYQLTADKLFDLIFGSNEFVQTYRQAQRFYDDTATEWIRNEATNCRERTLKYKVPYESTFVGKGTILTREKQTLLHEVPGSHYILETDVYNTGVKFCDTFSLIIRFCLVQKTSTTTNLRVTAHIIYNKSVNGIIKQLIERNAYSASQEGIKDLNNRLNLLSNFNLEKRRSSQTELNSITPTTEIIQHINQHATCSVHQLVPDDNNNNNNNNRSWDSDQTIHILVFLVIILLCTHIYLFSKLRQTDFLLEQLVRLLKI